MIENVIVPGMLLLSIAITAFAKKELSIYLSIILWGYLFAVII